MEIIGQKGLGNALKKVLQIFFYLGIIIILILPFILQIFEINLFDSAVIIYPNGIILLIITHKFIELFDSLKNNIPFCDNNIKLLWENGIMAFIGAWFWIIDLIYQIIFVKSFDIVFILLMIFLFILYIGVSIALYILSELFKQATHYKNENELTI